MNIIVNGLPQELAAGSSLETLLLQLKLSGRRLAVERNGEIVPRSRHAQTLLEAGDHIEIVHAIGGG